MGACNCLKRDSEEKLEDHRLGNELTKEKKNSMGVQKLLFLGAGGSGKSTIFKQLKQIHGEGWSKEYRLSFLKHIEFQIITEMKLAIETIEYSNEQQSAPNANPLHILSPEAQNAAATVKSTAAIDPQLTEELVNAIKLLWSEAEIKSLYANRAVTRIEDSAAHFWDKIEVIAAAGYVPSEEDVLLVRYRTTGVVEQMLTMESMTYHVFDVGGQQSERKKWIHCFENVTAVIFVVSLSCYDEVMFEDETVNSMVDTLELFGSICTNEWFQATSIILFLNKKDLFQEKLAANKPITLCEAFKGYEGNPSSFDESADYIRDTFIAINTEKRRRMFTHLTCATDRDSVQKVFLDVQGVTNRSSILIQDY